MTMNMKSICKTFVPAVAAAFAFAADQANLTADQKK